MAMLCLSKCPMRCRLKIGMKCVVGNSAINKDHSDIRVRRYRSNISEKYISVRDFYAGKSVFLTGSTGFIGKVILEKLLYTCTEVDKIYLLVRQKNGEPITNRTNDIFADKLFESIKKEMPENLSKVVPISGDLTEPGLGIKDEDKKILTEKVSVIFHSAAMVLLHAPWDVHLKNNFEGTKKILELCREIKNLQAFVHVSTASTMARYNNNKVWEEKIYPAPAEIEEVYDFAKKYNTDKIKTKEFLGEIDNTYSYVKTLTETYVAKNFGNIPTCIVRPSIVCAKLEEPQAGWVDKLYGLAGPLVYMATGWNRVVPGRRDLTPDIIPVDYVANTCIVAAARLDKSKGLSIYNSCSSVVNPVTWGEIYKYFSEDTVKHGWNQFPLPFVIFTESRTLEVVLRFWLQLLPAYLADFYLTIVGKEPRFVKTEKKIIHIITSLEFYTRNAWCFKSENVTSLQSSLSEKERALFPCDAALIDWRKYFHIYSQGVHKLLSEKKLKKIN